MIQPLATLSLPTSSSPVSQIAFHPNLPLILLQTSDKAVVALRIRHAEEVQAKQARRKKRDKEKKDKKKDQGVDVKEEAADHLPSGEVKWEDRVTLLCTVRANAKIRSFALSDSEAGNSKSGVPVSPD